MSAKLTRVTILTTLLAPAVAVGWPLPPPEPPPAAPASVPSPEGRAPSAPASTEDEPPAPVAPPSADGGAPKPVASRPAAAPDAPTSKPTPVAPTASTTGGAPVARVVPGDAALEARASAGAAAWAPAQELVDYVSTSSKLTEPVQQTPASVWVMTREQIELGGYRSVAEALAHVPGVSVGYNLDNYNVVLRGPFGGPRGGSRNIKVLIDGRPVSFAQSGAHYLGPEFIPMLAVERIEVVRGPVSATYGAGALTGAINIVTRRPSAQGQLASQTVLDASGTLLGARGGLGQGVHTIVGPRSFLLLAAGVGYVDRSGLGLAREDSGFWQDDRFADVTSRDDVARPISALIRGERYLGGGRLSALGSLQLHDAVNEFHELVTLGQPTVAEAVPGYGGARSQLYAGGVGLNFERPTGRGMTVLASAGFWTGGTRGGDFYDVEPAAAYHLTRQLSYELFEGGLELRSNLGGDAWVQAGVDGQVDNEHLPTITEVDSMAKTSRIRSLGQTELLANVGVYAQALVPVHDRLRVAGTVRLDQSNVWGGALSARAALVATPTPKIAVKLMGGRSYKAPSPEQLFAVGMSPIDVSGNEELTPEYVNGAELLVDFFIAPQVNLNVGGYYQQHVDSLAYVLEGGVVGPTTYDAEARGLEASVRTSFTTGPVRIDGSSGLALQELTTDEQVRFGIVEKTIPDNEGLATLMFNARIAALGPKGFGGQLLVRYSGERTPSQSNLLIFGGTPNMSDPAYMLGAYTVVDASLASPSLSLDTRQAASLRFRGGVANLLDDRYAEVGYNGVDIPTLGRTLWFTGTLTF